MRGALQRLALLQDPPSAPMCGASVHWLVYMIFCPFPMTLKPPSQNRPSRHFLRKQYQRSQSALLASIPAAAPISRPVATQQREPYQHSAEHPGERAVTFRGYAAVRRDCACERGRPPAAGDRPSAPGALSAQPLESSSPVRRGRRAVRPALAPLQCSRLARSPRPSAASRTSGTAAAATSAGRSSSWTPPARSRRASNSHNAISSCPEPSWTRAPVCAVAAAAAGSSRA